MNNPVTRSTLFLTELILDIFIFAVCTAVCAGLLVKASGLSRDSTRLTQAVYLAQSAAETFRAKGVVPSETQDGLTLSAALSGSGGLQTAEITVFSEDGRPVYSLTAARAEGVSLP